MNNDTKVALKQIPIGAKSDIINRSTKTSTENYTDEARELHKFIEAKNLNRQKLR